MHRVVLVRLSVLLLLDLELSRDEVDGRRRAHTPLRRRIRRHAHRVPVRADIALQLPRRDQQSDLLVIPLRFPTDQEPGDAAFFVPLDLDDFLGLPTPEPADGDSEFARES